MNTKRTSRFDLVCGFFLFALFLALVTPLYPQESNDSVGIDLYKKGDFANAVTKLQASSDFKDLYYLGLSYERLGKVKDAKKAFERSFKSGYQHIEKGLLVQPKEIKAGDSPVTPVKQLSVQLLNYVPAIQTSFASAERAFALKSDVSMDNEWILKGQFLYAINNLLKRGELAYSMDELDVNIKITAKPFPRYPEARNGQGTVILWVMFSADGKVTAATPVRSPGSNFSVEAVKASKRIVFTPAIRNGKPVTALRQVEYTFSIE